MIGIVGGMGPYAGIDLVKKIFDLTNASSDQDHIPVAMISTPHLIEDRTKYLTGHSKNNPGIAIAEIVNKLVSQGASIIGMPCNTAHAPPIFDKIKKVITNEEKKNKQHNIVAVGALYFSAILPAIKLPTGTTIIVIEFSEETLPLNMSGTSEAKLDLIIVRVLMIPKLTKKAVGKDTNNDLEFAKINIAIQAIDQ